MSSMRLVGRPFGKPKVGVPKPKIVIQDNLGPWVGPILDGIGGTLTGAFAPFQLISSWTDNLVRIRNDSASDTDIGQDRFGSLDEAAFDTHVGSGNGGFRRIYDQSGNDLYLSQTITAEQAFLIKRLGPAKRPVIDLKDDDNLRGRTLADFVSASTGYMLAIACPENLTLEDSNIYDNHIVAGNYGQHMALGFKAPNIAFAYNWDGNEDTVVSTTISIDQIYVMEWRHESGVLYFDLNGEAVGNTPSGDTTSLTSDFNIGHTRSPTIFNGKIWAVVCYSVPPSASDRALLVARAMAYVGL